MIAVWGNCDVIVQGLKTMGCAEMLICHFQSYLYQKSYIVLDRMDKISVHILWQLLLTFSLLYLPLLPLQAMIRLHKICSLIFDVHFWLSLKSTDKR